MHNPSLTAEVQRCSLHSSPEVAEMTHPASESDSDSAPEDIPFQEAKDDALSHIRTVKDAAIEKKKARKEINKKRQDMLKSQKERKKRKLEKLEAKKLPVDFLNDLSDAPGKDEEAVKVQKPANRRTTFIEAEEVGEEAADTEDFLALETGRTDFQVLTRGDLVSSRLVSSEATRFRAAMLYGGGARGGRVRREEHGVRVDRERRVRAAGGDVRVKAAS